jgi:hypothetical protein
MRARLALLAALFLSVVCAYAGTPDPVKLDKQKKVGKTISGTCGLATVQISDPEMEDPINSAGVSANTAITIKSGKSALKISPDPSNASNIFLQDRNKVHCVSTPAGPKLLLALVCDGRSCAPIDYRVIEPSTAKVINKLVNMDECDEVCAEKALGLPLPARLRE